MVEPSVRTSKSPFHHLAAPLFVWGIWALMLVAALGFVWRYGSNVPSWDDWDMVPTLAGQQPITAAWLWSQHNEHRVPLPRLTLLALNWITGIDFRVGMFVDIFALGALAFAMILVAGRLRGRISYSDAFFPLILLNWGQAANLLWGWQLQFVASTMIIGIALLMIVQSGARLRWSAAVVVGICLLLLPLCGANGLALVPALALWLIYSAILYWHTGKPNAKRNSVLIVALASAALLLTALYFVGYERVPYHPTSSGLKATLKTSIQFFTIGFGPATRAFWPISGLGILCLLLLSAAVLIVVWRNQPQERQRAAGLLSFLGAMASLALGLGLGRNGFETRYITLATPAWCCVYYVLSIYSPPKINFSARMLLLLIACITLWPNTRFGIAYATDLRSHLRDFEQEMEAGVPTYRLINRHQAYLHINQDLLTDYLPMLHHAGVGKFRFLRQNPPFREFRVSLVPTALNQMRWEQETAYGTGNDPYIEFALPETGYVSGIRLKYSYSNKEGSAPCRFVYWKTSDQNEFSEDRRSKYCPTGDRANWLRGAWTKVTEPEATTTIWVCDTITELRIYPDLKPCTFRISELVLLLPAHE